MSAIVHCQLVAAIPLGRVHPRAPRQTHRVLAAVAQTVSVGEGTGDEMCFNFAMVYPIDVFGEGERRKCGLL